MPRVLNTHLRPPKPKAEKSFCCRCKEDFPVAEEPARWQMGQMRKLKKAPRWIKDKFKEWIDSEIHGEGYFCGNCFFDLDDEREWAKEGAG